MRSNEEVLKAVALSIFIKKLVVSSTINNYTLNKLHTLTKLSYSTLRKRLKTLRNLGYIRYEGKNNNHLVFVSLKSSNNHKNIDLSKCNFSTIKTIEKSLLALFFINIQKQKDFVKHTIQTAFNPKNNQFKEMKKAKKLCKRYGYTNEYKEFGLSYKTISKRLGVSLQKAFNIVKFAIVNNMVVKYNNIKQFHLKGIGLAQKYYHFNDVTFYTKNNAYKVEANRYSIIA